MNDFISLISERTAQDADTARAKARSGLNDELAKIDAEVNAIEADLDDAFARVEQRETGRNPFIA